MKRREGRGGMNLYSFISSLWASCRNTCSREVGLMLHSRMPEVIISMVGALFMSDECVMPTCVRCVRWVMLRDAW